MRLLFQQTLDGLLHVSVVPIATRMIGFRGFVILAAGMHVADDPFLIDYKRNRCPAALFQIGPPAVKRRPAAIQSHGKSEAPLLGRDAHSLEIPIASRLGMENSNDLKPASAVFCFQVLQGRGGRSAVRAPVRPPSNENDLATQSIHFERRGVEPPLQSQARSRQAQTIFTTAEIHRPAERSAERQENTDGQSPPHGLDRSKGKSSSAIVVLRMPELFSLALALFGMAGGFAPPASTLHYDRMADRIVAALKPARGERVMFGGDPDYFQELATPLRMHLKAAGAVEVHSLDQADIYLWLPLRKRVITPEERAKLADWLDRGGAHREIHFHWAEGSVDPDGQAGEHSRALDRMYEDALDIDYTALSAAQDLAIQVLRSGVIRVKTPEGTDVTFRVSDRPFNKQDGNASAERMREAQVRVDREIELPAGVLRVAPIEASVNGFIVIPKARFPKGIATNVMIEVRHGDVTTITADSNVDAVKSALEAGGEAANRFREFALGFNPKLKTKAGAATTLPYYGYGAGVVRMSLGDNTELGGEVRGGFVRWFFFPDATVEVDGQLLTGRGKLIDPGQRSRQAH